METDLNQKIRLKSYQPPGDRRDEVQASAAAFSSDNKYLLVGFKPHASNNPQHRVIKLFDLSTGNEIRAFRGHNWGTDFIAFLSVGNQFLSTGGDRSFKIWNWETGALVRQVVNKRGSFSLFPPTPDGKKALNYQTLQGDSLELWDLTTGKLIQAYPKHKNAVRSMTISPDGKLALLGCYPYGTPSGEDDWTRLQVWDVAKGEVRLSFAGQKGSLYGPAAFSADGKLAISNKFDETNRKGYLVLWEVDTGKEIRTIEGSAHGTTITFTPDGKSILSMEESGNLKRFSAATGKQISSAEVAPGVTDLVAFSANGSLLFVGWYGRDGANAETPGARFIHEMRLEVWDTANPTMLKKLVPTRQLPGFPP